MSNSICSQRSVDFCYSKFFCSGFHSIAWRPSRLFVLAPSPHRPPPTEQPVLYVNRAYNIPSLAPLDAYDPADGCQRCSSSRSTITRHLKAFTSSFRPLPPNPDPDRSMTTTPDEKPIHPRRRKRCKHDYSFLYFDEPVSPTRYSASFETRRASLVRVKSPEPSPETVVQPTSLPTPPHSPWPKGHSFISFSPVPSEGSMSLPSRSSTPHLDPGYQSHL